MEKHETTFELRSLLLTERNPHKNSIEKFINNLISQTACNSERLKRLRIKSTSVSELIQHESDVISPIFETCTLAV